MCAAGTTPSSPSSWSCTPTGSADTVHDPAGEPALTVDQVRDIVTDPVWTAPASG